MRISPQLYVPCAGPLFNKVLAGEGCPAAERTSNNTRKRLAARRLIHPDTTFAVAAAVAVVTKARRPQRIQCWICGSDILILEKLAA